MKRTTDLRLVLLKLLGFKSAEEPEQVEPSSSVDQDTVERGGFGGTAAELDAGVHS